MSIEPRLHTVPCSLTAPRAHGRLSAQLARAALYLALTLGAVAMILPFVWMIATSLKTEGDIFRFPTELLPRHPTLAAYRDVWQRIPFGRFFLNSVVFAGGVTLISLFLDSLTAFALARLRFRGRDFCFWIILATLMVPFQITLIPLFVTVFRIDWLDTYQGLIVPRATNAFGIFLLRQFFVTLPRDLDDAARLDGASDFRVYWQVILPLAKPALATLAIFHFMFNWNDFLWPLVITTTTEMRTLPAGLTLFMGQYVIEHAVLMAGALISLLPLALAFFVAQRSFVRGVVMTGLKE
ncbi:MAG: carbohydrate ABC transporter permease [Chloroflexota bacterium]|nr:carbohydrate ABC transporter permease [Chloroflexota bacterium]